MTKKLSKQLCKLCGITPKCANCGLTVSDGSPCPKPCNKQKYPDFGQPENFVKLFKLIVTMNDYIYQTGYYVSCFARPKQITVLTNNLSLDEYESERIDPVRAFIECIIECAQNDKDTADYIKEQEWHYD